MLTHDNNPEPGRAARGQHAVAASGSPTRQTNGAVTAQVAHELNNLLDGGLRNLDLATASLKSLTTDRDRDDRQTALNRLDVSREAMRRMAELIRRWMHPDALVWFDSDTTTTIAQAVDQAIALLAAAAWRYDTQLRSQLPDEVGRLPAGPVYTIVVNALRNSIESISRPHDPTPANRPHRVQVTGRLDHGFVTVEVHDDGPGLDRRVTDEQGGARFGVTTKPEGCGMGLALCRDIAASLGGDIKLTPRTPCGATLTLRYPLTQNGVENAPTN